MYNMYEVLDKIDELEVLEDDWDGRGSPCPSKEVCNLVRELIHKISKLDMTEHLTPRAFAMPDGGIQIEYDNGRKHLEIEFRSPTKVVYLTSEELPDGEEDTEAFACPATDFDRLLGLVRWVHEH